MAYTPIDKGENFMSPVIYTGDGNDNRQITGVGFQPSWTWIKNRTDTNSHALFDAIRGATKYIESDTTDAEATGATFLKSFISDGFTLGTGGRVNTNNKLYASWNWIGASPPKKTYIVKVVSDGGNKYRFDDFGTNAVTLELSEGGTFIFDQSDSSNNGHPLRFSTTSNGTHGGGSIYTTGVVVSGTPGQAGAKTTITVAASAPTLYYFCTVHSGMGGQANTPTTNSFTNLDGSIQSNVSPNTISRFSIVKWTGNAGNATVGHGLGVVPKMIIFKNLSDAYYWVVYHQSTGNTAYTRLNTTDASSSSLNMFQNTTPTGSVFSLTSQGYVNGNNNNMVAYCFGDVQGFSKMGSYRGNGNATNNTFIYTGFKPSFFMCKRTDGAGSWAMFDNKREPFNDVNGNDSLFADTSAAENANDYDVQFFSNGVKPNASSDNIGRNGATYLYMAFAENPFTSAAGTPVTAF